jgi:hypothetical protein
MNLAARGRLLHTKEENMKPVHPTIVLALGVWFHGVTHAAPVQLVSQPPAQITNVAPGVILVDFGRVAFGNVRFSPPEGATDAITVHFGETFQAGRIDRKPPGTVRYNAVRLTLQGAQPVVAAPPADVRNTEQVSDKHPPAVLTPAEWGVVLPFRWVEIEGWPGELKPEQIVRQAAFPATWDDDAASFQCSDELLNRIWELCRYSIKATLFAGVYVDGDRERIPYEADGVGPEIQAKPGLEPRLGRRAGQPVAALRARRATAHARLGQRADPSPSR